MSIVRYRMVSLSLVIEVLPLIRKGRESAKSPTPYAGPNRFRFEVWAVPTLSIRRCSLSLLSIIAMTP